MKPIHVLENTLEVIGRAIRLDLAVALNLFVKGLSGNTEFDVADFGNLLMNINKCRIDPKDQELFEQFIDELKLRLGK